MLDLGIAIAILIFASACASWALSWLVRHLARTSGIVDQAHRESLHSSRRGRQPVPLLGGIAVYVAATFPACLLMLLHPTVQDSLAEEATQFLAMLFAGFVALLLGMIDDRRSLSARTKFLVQLPLALAFAAFVFHVDTLRIPGILTPIELGIFGIPITALWIVGVVNAMNLIDGVDGLAPGVALIAALAGAAFAAGLGQFWLMVLFLGLAGACGGFLVHNFAPARLYLGDTGSLMLGAMLALGMLYAADGARPYTVDPIILASVVLGYPIADTILAMARRLLHGKPVMRGDTEHIHHLLLARGFGARRAAVSVYIVAAMFATLAIALWINDYILIGLSLMGVSSALTLGLILIGFFRPFLPHYVRQHRPHYQLVYHLAGAAEARLRLAQSPEELLERFEQACRSLRLTRGEIIEKQATHGEPPLRHSWQPGSTNSQETASAADNVAGPRSLPISLSGQRWQLQGELATDELPEELVPEYLQRLAQLLELAEARLERDPTAASSSDALWPALPDGTRSSGVPE